MLSSTTLRDIRIGLRRLFSDEQEPNARMASRVRAFTEISDLDPSLFANIFRLPERDDFLFRLITEIQELYGDEALAPFIRAIEAQTNLNVLTVKKNMEYPVVQNSTSRKIDWLRAIAESAKGFPGGTIVLGGLLKEYDSAKGAQEREALLNKIEAMLDRSREITLEETRQLFSFSNAATLEMQLAFENLAILLQTQIRSLHDRGQILTAQEMSIELKVSEWPFPSVKREIVEAELFGVLGSRNDWIQFRELLERFFDIDTNTVVTNTSLVKEFTRSIHGRDRGAVLGILEGLNKLKPESQIISKLKIMATSYVLEGDQ